MGKLALTQAAVITPFILIEEATILVEDKIIKAIGTTDSIEVPPEYREINLEGFIVAPGLIDQHLHGGGGAEIMNPTIDSFSEVSRFLATHGITSFLATTITASIDELIAIAETYQKFKQLDYKGAKCLGLHLEGPYLSSDFAGVHSANSLRCPSVEEVINLQQKSDRGIKMITLAPELPGAIGLISSLACSGNIKFSVGHSNATYEETLAAITAGVVCATHCFNQMRPLNHREPGVLGGVLTSESTYIELIVDHQHLHEAIIKMIWKLKGAERIILVSDSMLPTGLTEGIYQTSVGEIHQFNNRLTDSNGRLSGSNITLDKAVKYFWEITGCELTDAFRLATYNPAKMLGINKKKGSLYPGKDADLIVLNSDLDVVMTMVEGEVISGLISID
ncbi:MAG TPA: N-acetylglucosamine-6-phosphate deacetylase [Bacillota bacterium]|nr:N-acetylglucosamine-6-phosphate deacetylase [Bacillota bacterium]HOL10923.1 N-acetylglucosamine-6-phosphate deacetylase [Bacillota bacterium]HPO98706.1 N-acetylglucosamine-6-phosphate deacetylase [Bacillota bacterium]